MGNLQPLHHNTYRLALGRLGIQTFSILLTLLQPLWTLIGAGEAFSFGCSGCFGYLVNQRFGTYSKALQGHVRITRYWIHLGSLTLNRCTTKDRSIGGIHSQCSTRKVKYDLIIFIFLLAKAQRLSDV